MSTITEVEQKPVFPKWLKLPEHFKPQRNTLILIAVILILTLLTDGTFLTARNLTNLCRQVAINGILAVGMTFVILLGGIDLSVGSVVALSGIIAGVLQVKLGLSMWTTPWSGLAAFLSMIAAVMMGAACGAFNGWMITRQKIAPFIITLGTMVIARGLALIFSNGAALAPFSDQFNVLGQGYLPFNLSLIFVLGTGLITTFSFLLRGQLNSFPVKSATLSIMTTLLAMYIFLGYRGLPIPVLIFAALAGTGFFIHSQTRLGRFILAIGNNPEAAWLSGLPIKNITFGVYTALGTLAGLCGVVLSARLNGAMPTSGELFELDAIAAVVIGGTSLRGGVGTVLGSVLGAFFIGILNNGMSLLEITEFYQKVIKGVIIILAVWMDIKQSQKS